MPWTQQQYEDAKALASGGGVSKELAPKLQARIAQYEDDRARGYLPAPAAKEQSPDVAAPKPAEKASWIPSRQLGVADYIPADAGGKLVNWHDMPVETYRRTIAAPQREQLIRDGIGAQALLAKFGTIATLPPDAANSIMMAIAKGKAAEAQTPDKITEEDPGYQAYNEQQWQEALQKHTANPDAGPMQRLTKLQGPGSDLARASAEILPKSIAFARGGLDSMTLGLGAGTTDRLLNAIEPGAGDQERSIQESRPWSSAAGNVAGMANPFGGGGLLFRSLYGGGKALLGAGRLARLGAGAAAGALSTAAEGAGQDISRGETDDLAAKTGERLFLGGAAGAGGEALSQAGGALAKKLDVDAVKRAGRPIFSWLESRGYKFSPLRGEVSSPEAKAQLDRAALDPEGRPVAQNISQRAGGPINDRVLAEAKRLTARQGAETEVYFGSAARQADVGPPTPASPLDVLPRPTATELSAHQAAMAKAASGVTPEEAEAVRMFTHGYDQSIRDMQRGASNDAVAASHPRGAEHAAEARAAIPHLESYMAKMPPATEVPIVYRGLTMPSDEAGQFLRQRTFTADPIAQAAVTSVSADPIVARSFVARNLEPGDVGVTLKLHHRSAVGTGSLASGRMQVEKELLIPGSAKFEVTGRYADTSNPGQFIVEAREVGPGHVMRGEVPTTETRRALSEAIAKHSGGPLDFTAPLEAELRRMPDSMTPRAFGAMMERIGASADSKAATGSAKMLADTWRQVEAGAMADLQKAPESAGARDWATIREHHNFETTRMERARQDTGVRDNASEWDFLNRDQQKPVRNAIETIGTPGARVETEQALKRFAPPDVRKELETLEAMNAARAHVNGPWTGLGSDSGTLKFMAGALRPRLYAIGREADRELGSSFPISDKLWTWLNSRAPRATQFLPGMGQAQIAQLIAKEDELSRRPKTSADLTPEQQAVLSQAMGLQGAQ